MPVEIRRREVSLAALRLLVALGHRRRSGPPGLSRPEGERHRPASSASVPASRAATKSSFGPGARRHALLSLELRAVGARDASAALAGAIKPAAAWLNHEAFAKTDLTLKRGANPLLLRYDTPGRGFFVVSTSAGGRDRAPPRSADAFAALPQDRHPPSTGTGRHRRQTSPAPASQPAPLAMRWYDNPRSCRSTRARRIAQPAGWYRFRAAACRCLPRALESCPTHAASVQAWVNGKAVSGKRVADRLAFRVAGAGEGRADGGLAHRASARLLRRRGASPGPITQDCVTGAIEPGDWSKIDGLTCYSGGAWYRRTVELHAGAGARRGHARSGPGRLFGRSPRERPTRRHPRRTTVARGHLEAGQARREPHRSASVQHAREPLRHHPDALSRRPDLRPARSGDAELCSGIAAEMKPTPSPARPGSFSSRFRCSSKGPKQEAL